MNEKQELLNIVNKFVESGWDLIKNPSLVWLNDKSNKEELIKAVEEADKECGSCGCEFDHLYKRFLELKNFL